MLGISSLNHRIITVTSEMANNENHRGDSNTTGKRTIWGFSATDHWPFMLILIFKECTGKDHVWLILLIKDFLHLVTWL